MSTPTERRKNTRVSFEALIDFACKEKFFPKCGTKNLSTKGVFIVGITGVELQDECDLTLYLSGGSDITLTMKGVIQRITGTGIGVHFTETDIDSFTHLRNIIYYNSKNPDIINEIY